MLLAGAAAQRASVLIVGPLGLSHLPTFLCLGIVPVVAGLAGDVLGPGGGGGVEVTVLVMVGCTVSVWV